VRHHGDPCTERHVERVERRADRIDAPSELTVGEALHSRRRLHRLVDDRDPVGVDRECAIEVITNGQWNLHVPVFPPAMSVRPAICDATRDKARL